MAAFPHFISCRSLHPNPISPDLQFLRIQLEGIKFRVGFTQLLSEQRFITLLFLLQIVDAVDPALHNRRTLAAAVDQIHSALLILLCFLAHKRIKFRSHLFSLFFVVRYIEAVNYQRLLVLVGEVQLLEEIFEQIYLVHLIPRNKVQLAVNRDRQGVQRAEIVQQDRVDLAAAKAVAEHPKLVLHVPAKLFYIKGRIVFNNVVIHPVRVAVIADVRQLVIAVGTQTYGLVHEFAGIQVPVPHVVAAVDSKDLL